jgi:glycine cleavage system aminomethyltransferase T
VQLWDVAVERQVEIVGPDAMALVELITPRDMSHCEIGQGMYAPLVDEFGGIVNDPIILRLGADRFWLSIADSDVLLWLKGIVWGRGYNVRVFEPDVSPLAVQGPKADALMSDLVGEHVRDIRFFRFILTRIAGTDVLLARSGWSGQGGFEVYLQDSDFANALWDTIWEAGQKYNIRAGCPNLIERIESGLMSHGNEMTLADNPFECGLDRFFKLGKAAEYMSRAALDKIAAQGVSKKLVCLSIEGEPMTPIRDKCAVFDKANKKVGVMTSCAYSPRLQFNIAFAMLDIAHCEVGTQLNVSDDQGDMRNARVCTKDWH